LQDSGAGMADRRVEDIVARTESARRELDAKRAERDARIAAEDAFKASWAEVYPNEGSLTEAVASNISKRYTSIVPGICEKNWDFRIAEWLSRPNLLPQFEIAIRIMAYSCAGKEIHARDCLIASRPLGLDVKRAHFALYEEFEQANALHGLPYTPLLSQTEMHKALGVSYDSFRWDVRCDRWKWHPEDDPQKHQRRWRHIDVDKHRAALGKIRHAKGKIIWRGLWSQS